MYLTIDALEHDVNRKIQQSDFNCALDLISNFVGEIVGDPNATSLVFASNRLDRLCLEVGKQVAAIAEIDVSASVNNRATGKIVVTIASHLEGYGGHTLVIEDMIRAQPDMIHILLVTDLFGLVDADSLVGRFKPIAEIMVAPCSASFDKLKWVAEQLKQICPEQIFLFNHHQDAVAVASVEPWLGVKKTLFYHHADHNLCLGVHLPDAVHIDPHNLGYFNCRSNLGISDNYYLPLVVEDKGSRALDFPFMQDGLLRSCSSGTWHKFKQPYSHSYIELICDRLSLIGGVHLHIGDLPDDVLDTIRARLVREDIKSDRFVHLPWAQSVWTALIENNIDLYISSFPLGGGRAAIEAMGSGTPLLMHSSDVSRFNGGNDLAYSNAFEWKNPEEFYACIKAVTPEVLCEHSKLARDHYENHHMPAAMKNELACIIKGEGSMTPTPLKEYKPDVLQRYLHRVGVDKSKVLEQQNLISDISAQLREKNERVVVLDDQLRLIHGSLSWVMTKPVRFAGRVARGDFSQIKQLLKKTPIPRLLYPVRCRLRGLFSVLSPFNSKQNKRALANSSCYRSGVLFSPQHRSAEIDPVELPLIDISVVTYNNTNWLGNFINSLHVQDYPLSLINLNFVDNGSTDDSLLRLNEVKGQYEAEFNLIEVYSQSNKGFGAGHDFAIRKGKARFVLVTNIDLEFEHDAILRAVSFAVNDREEVASWEFRQKPYEHPKHYDPVSLDTVWSSHACVLLRRSAYNQVGGYEPKIFMYGEDVELSYRLREYGFRLKYLPSSVVDHYTYKEAGEIKPIQFGGSTLANMYIRLRYGVLSDRLAGALLQVGLVVKGGGFNGSRLIAAKNCLASIKNASYFLSSKRQNGNSFPFRGFDYEMVRDGAFHQSKKLEGDLPLVTIVTRTYKGRENWLKECVSSVINQTYSNIQHVIVEDGGDTMALLVEKIQEQYGASYRVAYKDLPKKGRSFAGNIGLSIAEGQYLMFLDDDDLLYPDHVETLMAGLRDSSCAAAYSLAWEVATEVEGNGEQLKYTEHDYHLPDVYRQEFSREKLMVANYIPIQAILFQRKLYDELGGFDETMDYLEDWGLWAKYGSKYDFVYIPKTTSLYRVPYSHSETVERKALLDAAYGMAKEKQKSFSVG